MVELFKQAPPTGVQPLSTGLELRSEIPVVVDPVACACACELPNMAM